MSQFDLKRGVKKSKAKHVSIQKFYTALNEAANSVKEVKEQITKHVKALKDKCDDFFEKAGQTKNVSELKKEIEEAKSLNALKDKQIKVLSNHIVNKTEEINHLKKQNEYLNGKQNMGDEDFDKLVQFTQIKAKEEAKKEVEINAKIEYQKAKRDAYEFAVELATEDLHEIRSDLETKIETERHNLSDLEKESKELNDIIVQQRKAQEVKDREAKREAERAYARRRSNDSSYDLSPSPF